MTPVLTTLGLIGATVGVASAFCLVRAWRGAAEGYEDETGFHLGAHPQHRAVSTSIELGRAAGAKASRRDAVNAT